MKKFTTIFLIVVGLIILAVGVVKYTGLKTGVVQNTNSVLDATYILDGEAVTLKGTSTARYFGNEVKHDFDGDGREDAVFIVTQSPGGSGTFYYVVAALNQEGGFVGSHGVLLGDRIAPQTTEMGKGNIVVVNYADRKFDEPMVATPSVGKSIWLLLDPKTMQFGEVAQNFEGESNLK